MTTSKSIINMCVYPFLGVYLKENLFTRMTPLIEEEIMSLGLAITIVVSLRCCHHRRHRLRKISRKNVRGVCKFSSRTAPKGTGQLLKFLKNATSLIRQSVDHGNTTYTKGKYAVQSGNLTKSRPKWLSRKKICYIIIIWSFASLHNDMACAFNQI